MALRAGLAVLAALALVTSVEAQTPSLDGVWTNNSLTYLQRPANYGERLAMSPQEAAEAEAKSRPYRGRPKRLVMRVDGQPRTSFIISTADGRIPPRLASAPPLPASDPARRNDNPEGRSLLDRCLMGLVAGGSPTAPVMLPDLYFIRFQFVQTKDELAIMSEQIHDVRHIRIGAKTHGTTRRWMGDSIGHWQGQTLVVETINFDPRQSFYGASPNLKVTERFTRKGADRLLYQFTVEDPTVWAKPWSGEYEFGPTAGQLEEFACHEQNYALEGILAAQRADEAKPMKISTPG